jgi:hypothetical protein
MILSDFPTRRIQQLIGEPRLYGLVAIFRHMFTCAQIQLTNYGILKWLYLVMQN